MKYNEYELEWDTTFKNEIQWIRIRIKKKTNKNDTMKRNKMTYNE